MARPQKGETKKVKVGRKGSPKTANRYTYIVISYYRAKQVSMPQAKK